MRLEIFLFCTSAIIYSSAFPNPSERLVPSTEIMQNDEPQELSTISALKYLGRFGYMSRKKMKSQLGSLIDIRSFRKAVRKFQKMFELEPTGELDEPTQRMMLLPRCGVKDSPRTVLRKNHRHPTSKRRGGRSRSKRYVLQGGRWRKRLLKYHILNYTPDLTKAQVDISIEKAFELWSNHTNLNFVSTKDSRDADIKISFGRRKHGDFYPFDGRGGELAHAYYPSDGRAHFDDDELFTFGADKRGVDLFTVAAHEFGHNLGLSHSGVKNALMEPVYKGYVANLKLHADDIAAIQQLYGKKVVEKSEENLSELCSNTKPIDSMHYDLFERAYFVFIGENVWKVNDRGVVDGYPKKIWQIWRSLPGSIDASAYSPTTRRTYFFKGNKIWRFNDQKRLEAGFPQPTSSLGLPSDAEAAVQLRRDSMIYIFKDGYYHPFSEYQRYNGVNHYGRRRIDGRWRNLPSEVDAVVRKPDGNINFVKEDQVWGFSSSGLELNRFHPKSFKTTLVKCTSGATIL